MNEQLPQTESPLRRLMLDLINVETDDPVRHRRGRLVNLVLLLALGITLSWLVAAGTLAAVSMLVKPADVGMWRLIFFAIVLSATYALNRRSASPFAGLVLAQVTMLGSILSLILSGPQSTSVITLTLPVLIAGLLGPPPTAFVMATLALLVYGAINLQHDPAYLSQLFREGAGGGTVIVYINLYIVATLAWLFSRMAGRAIRQSHAELQTMEQQRQGLEARLERQASHLQAATRVARALSGVRNLDMLLADVARLVREYFGYDFVQVYLLDAAREYAVLHAATGMAGETLQAAGHQLPVQSMSAVGQAAALVEPVVVDTSSHDTLPIQHVEGMPPVLSELAVPLVAGQELIGVLAVQSLKPDAFQSRDLPGFQALADQIAFSIANVRVYEEAQQNLRELSGFGREAIQRGWSEYLSVQSQEGRLYRRGRGKGWADRQKELVERVVSTGNAVLSESHSGKQPGHMAVPILLRDEVIGVIGLEKDEAGRWTHDDVRVLEGIAERTALAVENMRLFEQAKRSANRERLVNEIARNVQRAESVDDVLQAALLELGRALGASRGVVQLRPQDNARQPSRGGDPDDQNGKPVSEDNVVSEEGQS